MPPSLGGACRASSTRRPRIAQALPEQRRQQRVEEAAAAQRHGAQAGAIRGLLHPAGQPVGHGVVEQRRTARAHRLRRPGARSAGSGRAGRRRMQAPARPARRPARAARPTGSQRLQQHRRLALVGRRVAHAQQAGRGVEPAAHAGGRRAAQPARQHLRHRAGAGWWPKRASISRRGRGLAAPPRPCARARVRRRRRRAGRSAPDGRAAGRLRRRRAATRRPRRRRPCPGRCRPAPGRAAGLARHARPQRPRCAHGGAAPHAPAARGGPRTRARSGC